ncbi:putative methyltransferase C9orf114 homolog [Leptopilina boulardi]|uniref:putative methyltransferase C9orf114 homolog n=1 Tax=Leptopilina boulardi TaxID=63433 RepID=UPI0021F660C2|nr:putative methyltransferase C9orf114 homolog [Leptopilina boulardi]XP_051172140.1 putative methyltransferase C9orf114 homolog [Leptopilina boulardi]
MSGNLKKNWIEHNAKHKEKRKNRMEQKLEKKCKRNVVSDEDEVKGGVNKNGVSTVSIAVPGSILDNAQTPELRTYLAGQIARAACIYKVDEIVVFDDKGDTKVNEKSTYSEESTSCLQLARILQYLECPQYLRKYFFPLHKDLQFAGLLNPLDAPHHLRQQDISLFREGVVKNKPNKVGKGSQVNVGLFNDVYVDKVLTPGIRVTVKLCQEDVNLKKLNGIVVSPKLPRSETGIYWGYSVRLANCISEIFTKCPYTAGYDLSIGTSDKGSCIDDIPSHSLKYHHSLIVFGGLSGLESAIEQDPVLNTHDPALLFNKYFNTCPEQASRIIRTEEAILISLAELRHKLSPIHCPVDNQQFSDNNFINNS